MAELQEFDAVRMAYRSLVMGDVLSVVKIAPKQFDQEKTRRLKK